MSADVKAALAELQLVVDAVRRRELASRISKVKAAELFGPAGKRDRGLVVKAFCKG